MKSIFFSPQWYLNHAGSTPSISTWKLSGSCLRSTVKKKKKKKRTLSPFSLRDFSMDASHAEKSPIYHLNTLHRGPILDTDHDNTSALILLPCRLHTQSKRSSARGEFELLIKAGRRSVAARGGNDFPTPKSIKHAFKCLFSTTQDTRGNLNGRSHICKGFIKTAPALEIFCPFVFKGDGLLKSELSRGRLCNQMARALIECGGKNKQTVAKKQNNPHFLCRTEE